MTRLARLRLRTSPRPFALVGCVATSSPLDDDRSHGRRELGGTDEDGMTPAEKRKAARDEARARRANADEDENEEPLGRNTVSDDRREEIEAQRAKLREERLNREERRLKREELMQRRRERREAGEDVGVVRTPTITPDDFGPTHDPDEGDEGDYGDEGEFEGEFEDGSGPGDGDYEDEGDYAEERAFGPSGLQRPIPRYPSRRRGPGNP